VIEDAIDNGRHLRESACKADDLDDLVGAMLEGDAGNKDLMKSMRKVESWIRTNKQRIRRIHGA